VPFLEIGADDVVQHIFSYLAGASTYCEYELEKWYCSGWPTVQQGNSHQPQNELPAREWVRSGHIEWLFAATLLGESLEAFSGDEALRDTVG
jgi:hypothetical protein